MSRKVQIYCLINPIDESVFYVGATVCKLKARLNGHCNEPAYELGSGIMQKRFDVVNMIKSVGLRPIIKLLETVEFEIVDKKEKEYFNNFTLLGHTLLQSEKQFQYSTHPKIREVNRYIQKSWY